MSEINIAGAIDKLMIYDDPEYCENTKNDEKCDGLVFMMNHEDDRCVFFPENGYPRRLDYDDDPVNWIKCDQCKDAYLKAVNEKLFDEEKQYTPDGP